MCAWGQKPSQDSSHITQDGQGLQAPAPSLCSGLSWDPGWDEAEDQAVPWHFCGVRWSPWPPSVPMTGGWGW